MRTTLLCLFLVIACGGSGRTNPDPDPDALVADDAPKDGTPGGSCGGLSREACAANEYCDYADNGCGIADGPATCKRRPDFCPAIAGQPVCACDDRVHISDCGAFSDGFDLNANGSCMLPAGRFACGYAVCNVQTQYCRREVKPPAADLYTCLALPTACTTATPTCKCLSGEPCGASCTGDASAGLTLTCQ